MTVRSATRADLAVSATVLMLLVIVLLALAEHDPRRPADPYRVPSGDAQVAPTPPREGRPGPG